MNESVDLKDVLDAVQSQLLSALMDAAKQAALVAKLRREIEALRAKVAELEEAASKIQAVKE